MHEPRDCHIEWSNSENEKQVLYINTYIWNLESDIDHLICKTELKTHVENKYKDIKVGKGGWNELGDEDWHLYTIHTIYKTDN